MQLSKIGSKNTYHKCIKQLHEAKYIYYHPAVNRFHLVRISVIPLDKQEELPTRYKQLDLFSTDFDTGSVPNLGQSSTDFDTVPVSKVGHIIKPNIKQRETPTHEIFKKNKKIQKAVNDMGGVPKMGQTVIVALSEVEGQFLDNNYPKEEAKKFYNHYKAIGWKIQGVTPIEDWKALVEKWMQNAKKWEDKKQPPPASDPAKDIQYLYDSFLEGKKIFHHITAEHFLQLKLELNEETIQQAWKERINQVSGTNQHSMDQLWQAYLTGDSNNELIKRDNHNLIALAKRIAVINHFHNLKTQSQ